MMNAEAELQNIADNVKERDLQQLKSRKISPDVLKKPSLLRLFCSNA